MALNPSQGGKDDRQKALEEIARRRQEELRRERELRERKAAEAAAVEGRQQEAVKQDEALAERNLEARHEFTLEQRHKRFAMEEERKKKLEEEKKREEELRKKKEEEDAKKEYMSELHAKSVRKKIAARRESIAKEEEASLAVIDNREHEDNRDIDAQLKMKLEHLEHDAKQEADRAHAACERAKAVAGEKRLQDLQQLKQESFRRESQARLQKEPDRTRTLTQIRTDASAKRMQIERDYKAALKNADAQLQEGDRTRKITLQKNIAQAKTEAEQKRAHSAKIAGEHRNEVHVRRVGEEQWLLGKE